MWLLSSDAVVMGAMMVVGALYRCATELVLRTWNGWNEMRTAIRDRV